MDDFPWINPAYERWLNRAKVIASCVTARSFEIGCTLPVRLKAEPKICELNGQNGRNNKRGKKRGKVLGVHKYYLAILSKERSGEMMTLEEEERGKKQ